MCRRNSRFRVRRREAQATEERDGWYILLQSNFLSEISVSYDFHTMLSVVIPAYNEEDGIAEMYRRIVAAAPAWGEEFEILIVDDGRRDRTLEICEQIAAADSRF